MIGIETWAIGIIAVAVLALFGHHLVLGREIRKQSDDLAAFREHVAQEYARNGVVEKGFDKLVAAMEKLSDRLEKVSLQVAGGSLTRGPQP